MSRLNLMPMVMVLAAASGAFAQEAAPAQEAQGEPREMDPVGAWRIICAESGCVARQDVPVEMRDGEGGPVTRSMTVVLGVEPGTEAGQPALMTVATDLDIHVQPGMGLIRDEKRAATPIWRGDIETCGRGCSASAPVDTELLAGASAPAITMLSADGTAIGIRFSTEGLDEALDYMRAHDAGNLAAAAAPAESAAAGAAPAPETDASATD